MLRTMPVTRGICLATVVVCLGMIAQSFPALAKFNPPTNVGRPGNREGAASRGGECKFTNLQSEPTLTAMVPVSNVGLTTAAYPTFYWYMPTNTYRLASFELYEDETPIYQSSFQINGRSGVSSLKLPAEATLPPLEVGKTYRWSMTLICDLEQPDTKKSVEGFISRVNPTPQLTAALAKAKPEARSNVYAEAGLWYDALAELAVARSTNPGNQALVQQMKGLLSEPSVRLDKVATQISSKP